MSRDTVGDLSGASWAFDTAGRQFYQPQVGVAAAQKWTFSAKDRVLYAAGTVTMATDWYNSTGTYLGESTGPVVNLPAPTLTGGTWTTVSATFTVPAGATNAHVLQFADFGSATHTAFKSTECDYAPVLPAVSDQAAVRYGWGSDNPAQSDEYNSTSVDLTKWGLFGAAPGQTTGCTAGFNGHGQRCASQTTEAGGYLTITAMTDGKTGGLYSTHGDFKYGRIEIRERALPTQNNGGSAYHAVPLLFPATDNDYTSAEIDFAERDVAVPVTEMFVHHDNTQTECHTAINSTQFHNYAVDWEPTSVTWYVDGKSICTVNAAVDYFDHPNGGAQLDMYPNSGTTMQPAREDVDWIRMYPTSATQYQH